jgi:hypothetical protein
MSGTDSKAGGADYLYLFTQAKSIGQKITEGRSRSFSGIALVFSFTIPKTKSPRKTSRGLSIFYN